MFDASDVHAQSPAANPHSPTWRAIESVLDRLVALGPVLCLYRREHAERLRLDASSLLSGVQAQAVAEIDRDGPREALCFSRPGGTVVVQVCLLPDTDFLAWERLIQSLADCSRRGEPCRPRWSAWLRWQASAGRFCASGAGLQFEQIASMSASGQRSAQAWSARCCSGLVRG